MKLLGFGSRHGDVTPRLFALLATAILGDPTEAQRSGFGGERRCSEVSDSCRLRREERYAACTDVAGMVGLEPTNAGVKVPCLTTWLHPNIEMRQGPERTLRPSATVWGG